MRYDIIVARYGEIGLKSRPVRRRFEQALQDNVERAFEDEGCDVVVARIPGRFLITSRQPEPAMEILTRIFGLTSVSPARLVASDLATLLPAVGEYFQQLAQDRPQARTFALRVRRSGQHPYTSQDVARQGGGAVLATTTGQTFRVDLDAPDIEISIEVRDRQAYIFHERRDGPGGLPMGTQGKVVVFLKDLQSLIAAWLMMKRGCTIVPVTFLGPTGNPNRARVFADVLHRWYFRGQLVEVPHEEASQFPAREACVLCMRQMIRKGGLVARRKKARAIVTGESFTSTTTESLTQFGGLVPIPVLRPLLGMTPQLVAEFAQRMGVEAGRVAPLYEPCPLRVRGRVDDATVQRLEAELGHEVRAFESVRERVAASVKT